MVYERPCGVSLVNVCSRRVRPAVGMDEGHAFLVPVKGRVEN